MRDGNIRMAKNPGRPYARLGRNVEKEPTLEEEAMLDRRRELARIRAHGVWDTSLWVAPGVLAVRNAVFSRLYICAIVESGMFSRSCVLRPSRFILGLTGHWDTTMRGIVGKLQLLLG